VADKPSVVEALSAVMAEVQAVGKGDRNTDQGYNFRGIDAVINAVGPVFRKHGVIALPVKCQASYRDVLTSREKRSRECTVAVTYRFYGPAGDFIDCEVPGESMDFGDKGAPKAMSVAYRIALLQALCIPTHDPEPDAQSYERADQAEDDPEQGQLFDDYADEIRKAKSYAEIESIGARVKSALAKGDLSKTKHNRLGVLAGERAGQLNGGASHDGAGARQSAEVPA